MINLYWQLGGVREQQWLQSDAEDERFGTWWKFFDPQFLVERIRDMTGHVK